MDLIKILIIEDEPKVASFIKKGLEELHYRTEICNDGIKGKNLALTKQFDLIIVDIMLPNMSGFQLIKEFREVNSTTPVLILTALGTTDNKLTGFETGADDYLVKPFEFRELVARIKALLKRSKTGEAASRILKLADLELNIDSKTVTRGKKSIELTAKEFSLLEYLLRNKGKVVSRAEIAEQIWDIRFDTGTNVIDVYINFLRKKIDRDFDKKLIHTYIGIGYIMKEE